MIRIMFETRERMTPSFQAFILDNGPQANSIRPDETTPELVRDLYEHVPNFLGMRDGIRSVLASFGLVPEDQTSFELKRMRQKEIRALQYAEIPMRNYRDKEKICENQQCPITLEKYKKIKKPICVSIPIGNDIIVRMYDFESLCKAYIENPQEPVSKYPMSPEEWFRPKPTKKFSLSRLFCMTT